MEICSVTMAAVLVAQLKEALPAVAMGPVPVRKFAMETGEGFCLATRATSPPTQDATVARFSQDLSVTKTRAVLRLAAQVSTF